MGEGQYVYYFRDAIEITIEPAMFGQFEVGVYPMESDQPLVPKKQARSREEAVGIANEIKDFLEKSYKESL